MTALLLLLIPFGGGLLALAAGRLDPYWPRRTAVLALLAELLLALVFWGSWYFGPGFGAQAGWLTEIRFPWLPGLGSSFHVGLDGLSLSLVLAAAFLGLTAVAASWSETRNPGLFHFMLLWCLTGIMGVFLALDLFLFYFFWELMLLPMYFLLRLWGQEQRGYAATKFFLFTQISGLLLLAALLGLCAAHGRQTGLYTFDAQDLLATRLGPVLGMWLLLGFLAAFLVKLHNVVFHTWLPEAVAAGPAGARIMLAGPMLLTGAYGLLRFAIALFPDAAADFLPAALALGTASILYGAFLASSQENLKRLIAYAGIGHSGFILLGAFTGNELTRQGAVVVAISSAVGISGLFLLEAVLRERVGSSDLEGLGGLWPAMPRLGSALLLLTLAALGLPGLGNFVGEFLVLLGTYRVSAGAAAAGAAGMIVAVIYGLRLVQGVLFGPEHRDRGSLDDLAGRGLLTAITLAAVLLWLGLYPQPLLDTAGQGLRTMDHFVAKTEGTP